MKGVRKVLLALVLLILAVPAAVLPAPPPARAAGTPFGFGGREITSPDGVRYAMYSGEVASFDGLPLAADVTIPAGARGPLPLIVMFHGWTQNRTYWESPTITNANPDKSGWNNVAFAARSYVVLNYTIRGWHDSCGPADAAVRGNPATLPAACTTGGRQYWIHVADPKWEIRDAQTLIGKLVCDGVADPARIGVTGQSYGGGHSWFLALQNDRVMNPDGAYSPWTSPGGVPLSIAAALVAPLALRARRGGGRLVGSTRRRVADGRREQDEDQCRRG